MSIQTPITAAKGKIAQVGAFERGFLSYLHSKEPKLLEGIRTKKALDSDLENTLKSALETFSKTFA